MLRIIDRYIIREISMTILAVIVVLLLVLLGNTLLKILNEITAGKFPSDVLLPLLGINLINYFSILLPFAVYLGIMLAMGRLYRDQEMAAISACGIGNRSLYRPLLMLSVPVVLIAAIFSLYVAPWASGVRQHIEHQAENRPELSGIMPGRFTHSNSGLDTLFVESISEDRTLMANTFLHRQTVQGQAANIDLIIADTANQRSKPNTNNVMLFHQGVMYSGEPGMSNYRIIEFERYGALMEIETVAAAILKERSKPISALINSDNMKDIAELQWRLSIPLLCFILILLALPMSHTSPRKGRYAKLAISILIYIIYSNLLGVSRAWVERELVPTWIGLWWVHALMLSLVILVLLRQSAISNQFWQAMKQRVVST